MIILKEKKNPLLGKILYREGLLNFKEANNLPAIAKIAGVAFYTHFYFLRKYWLFSRSTADLNGTGNSGRGTLSIPVPVQRGQSI